MSEQQNYDTTVDTLAEFGPTFQSKAIAALLTSPEFVQQSLDVMDANFFELDESKWIVRKAVDYFSEYKTLPTMEVFKLELNSVSDTDTRQLITQQLRNVFFAMRDTDLDYVKDKFLEFAKNQRIKSAIVKSASLLQSGRYDDIKRIVDAALRSGQPRTIGHDWKKDIDIRMNRAARNTIRTGWTPIDMLTDGGLAAGELGVIMAPSGAGKSWALATIGANAVRNGKKVIHYTLELNDIYTALRYDTIYSGIEPKSIQGHKDKVTEIISGITGEIIFKYYPARTVTTTMILSHVHQLTSLGHRPDLLIIDYADLMTTTVRSDARHEMLGIIYEELRGLAGELAVPIWTASQTQRSAIKEEIIEADKVSASYEKIMTADFVLSISRTMEDKLSRTGRGHLIKNRFGPDGLTFPMIIDTSIGKIEIFDENSIEGMKIRREATEEATRDREKNKQSLLSTLRKLSSTD